MSDSLTLRALTNLDRQRDEVAEVQEGIVAWVQQRIDALREHADAITLERAGAIAQTLEMHALLHSNGVHLIRYTMGAVALVVKDQMPHGSDAMGRCADMWGLHANTLRYYASAVKRSDWNARHFAAFLDSEQGRYKTQDDVIAYTQVMKDRELMPEEAAKEIKKRKYERAVSDIEETADAFEGDPDEAQGAVLQLADAVGVRIDDQRDAIARHLNYGAYCDKVSQTLDTLHDAVSMAVVEDPAPLHAAYDEARAILLWSVRALYGKPHPDHTRNGHDPRHALDRRPAETP